MHERVNEGASTSSGVVRADVVHDNLDYNSTSKDVQLWKGAAILFENISDNDNDLKADILAENVLYHSFMTNTMTNYTNEYKSECKLEKRRSICRQTNKPNPKQDLNNEKSRISRQRRHMKRTSEALSLSHLQERLTYLKSELELLMEVKKKLMKEVDSRPVKKRPYSHLISNASSAEGMKDPTPLKKRPRLRLISPATASSSATDNIAQDFPAERQRIVNDEPTVEPEQQNNQPIYVAPSYEPYDQPIYNSKLCAFANIALGNIPKNETHVPCKVKCI